MPNIIITRHSGAVEWLRNHGVEGPVLDRATPDDVRGQIVYGVLPLELAAEAKEVWTIRFQTSEEARKRLTETGGNIPAEEMETLGAELVGFRVERI